MSSSVRSSAVARHHATTSILTEFDDAVALNAHADVLALQIAERDAARSLQFRHKLLCGRFQLSPIKLRRHHTQPDQKLCRFKRDVTSNEPLDVVHDEPVERLVKLSIWRRCVGLRLRFRYWRRRRHGAEQIKLFVHRHSLACRRSQRFCCYPWILPALAEPLTPVVMLVRLADAMPAL